MTVNTDDPDHWRSRAQQARILARNMPDAASTRLMLNMAADYDHLAKVAEERLRHKPT